MWAWWATRSFNYGGDTPAFYIATASHYNLEAGERLGVWGTAADTDNWNDFTTVTIGTPDITFTHGSAFPSGMIYVAALPMYPFSRVQRKMGEWGTSAWVSETTSSTNFKVGTATARTVPDNSGRTVPALPYYGFKLTGDRVGNKNKAILRPANIYPFSAGLSKKAWCGKVHQVHQVRLVLEVRARKFGIGVESRSIQF